MSTLSFYLSTDAHSKVTCFNKRMCMWPFLLLRKREKDGDRCGITADCQKSGNDEHEKKTKRKKKTEGFV